MEFLNIALLTGMAVASLPVIIHLLNRRKARVIDWGAMRFLELSLASRGRRILLEEIILLVLRTAMLALLVTAMARPLLVNPNFAGAGAAGQDVVILIDGSMSMSLVPPGAGEDSSGKGQADARLNYFELAKRAATQAIDGLAPGDAVAVVLAGSSPQRLTEQLTFDRNAAKAAVVRAQLTDGVMNATESLALACRLLESGKNAHKQVLLVSDGRSHGWRIESAQEWQALAGKLAGGSRPPRVQVLGLGWGQERAGASEPLLNLSIEQVKLSRPVIGTDLPVVLTAVVRNTGQLASPAGVRLSLRTDPSAEPIDAQPLPSLAPMAQATVQLVAHFTKPGPYRLLFDLDLNDALAADNRLVYALEVLRSLPVLLVNGDPQAAFDQDECFWLRAAFQPAWKAGEAGEQPIEFLVSPTTVEPSLLAQQDLNRYYAVVLANVVRLEPAMLDRMKEHVRNGGGLLVAPGDKIDRASYNGPMFEAGRGLLPASLGESVELVRSDAVRRRLSPDGDTANGSSPDGDTTNVTVAPPPQGHPGLIGSIEPTLWESMRAFRHYPLSPAQNVDVATVLRLSNGAAFALDRPFGQGRVILLGGPLDTAWSNLPLHNGYVILVNELMYYLSSPRRTTLNLPAGQMLAAPAPIGRQDASARVRTPAGQTFDLTRVLEGGRWLFKYAPSDPGVYELHFSGGTPSKDRAASELKGSRVRSEPPASQPDDTLFFTVQRDPGESFLTLLDEPARQQVNRALAGSANFHTHASSWVNSLKVTDPGREIWKWLAAGVLGMLLAEVWLTRRITRRRRGQLAQGLTFGPGAATTRAVR